MDRVSSVPTTLRRSAQRIAVPPIAARVPPIAARVPPIAAR
jgi:hypothetical protein